jgi:hypothetical protein
MFVASAILRRVVTAIVMVNVVEVAADVAGGGAGGLGFRV